MDNQNLNNEVINETENTEATAQVAEKKKPGKVAAVFVAIGALIVFLLVQFIISGIAATTASVKLLAEYGAASAEYLEAYTNYVLTPEFLTPVTIIGQFTVVIVMIIWYFFGYVRKTSKEKKAEINKKVFTVKTLLTVVSLGVGFYGIDLIVANIVSAISPNSLEFFNSTMNQVFDFSSPLAFIAVVIMAPIGEELTFRGVALNKMKKAQMGMWPIVLITVVLFAIAHMNLLQSVYVIPLAIVLGIVSYRYESIIPTIAIHLVNNGLAILMGSILPDNTAVVIVVMVVFAVLGLGGTYAIQKDNLFKHNA